MKDLTIRTMRSMYENKELSPVEVTRYYLERITKFNHLNAYITVCPEKALKQAEIAERKYMVGEQTGMLEGIPLSYKDNIETKGIRTTSGSKIDEDFIPSKDAGIVHTLQREGAINLGKVNMHEYAFGITSNNPFYGPVRNPWNAEFTPGGSSGGSGAAVALSLGMASIGTDTAGSIRIPAASCGTIGLKPTHGLVDASGVKPISWTLDHVGPITKNTEDLAFMLEAMTGNIYSDALREDIRGLRIGVPKNYFTDYANEAASIPYKQTLGQLESLGAILIEVDIPYSAEDLELSFAIGIAEAGFVHENSIVSALDSFGADVKASLQGSHQIPALHYIKALHRRSEIAEQFQTLFKTVDIIATPALPDTAQKIGQETMIVNGENDSTFMAMIRLSAIFNLTGQPALSIPGGLAANGLPVGIQLAGAKYNEKTLIQAAFAYEQAYLQDFYKKRNELDKA